MFRELEVTSSMVSTFHTDDFILKVTASKVTENTNKVTEKLPENSEKVTESTNKVTDKLPENVKMLTEKLPENTGKLRRKNNI